jgi:hypothetical protein
MRIPMLSLAALAACSAGPNPDTTDPKLLEPFEGALAEDEVVVQEVPVATIELGGDEYEFFAWEDGSAGLLHAGSGRLAPELEGLEDASVAEVFWALSDPGTPIPDLLQRHHEQMAAEWGTSPDPRVGPQGWLAEEVVEMPEGVPAIPSQCTNATFNSNICGSATYPNGPGCFNNVTGSIGWYTAGTSRYRAGLCVQAGSANDYLSYAEYTNSSSCNVTWRVLYTIWGYSFNSYPSPHSNIYLSWWWIAPSNAPRRAWDHVGSNYSGAVYDWGTKTLDTSDCRY